MLGTGTFGAHGSAGISLIGSVEKLTAVMEVDGPRKMVLSRLKVAYYRDFFYEAVTK